MKIFEEIESDFKSKIFKEIKIDCNYKYIFRGLASEEYNLQTSLVRSLKNEKNLDSDEHKKLNKEYKEKLCQNLNINISSHDNYDKPFYHIFQHYGALTNILDWTIDPDIALYFAIFETKPEKDILNILSQWSDMKIYLYSIKINYEMVDKPQAESSDGILSVYDPMNLLHWNKKETKHHKQIYEKLIQLNTRLKRQQGLFTYHKNINDYFCINEYFKNRKVNADYNDNNLKLQKYIVEVDKSLALNIHEKHKYIYNLELEILQPKDIKINSTFEDLAKEYKDKIIKLIR
ncbi:MAG: hypothetical protein ACD_79C01492G0001 [uncultured bacterium]|nr:MAG: hypothetical protein ACD_79C01492G0001 [uncultured bacterium]